jgi:hypothetical protein
MALGRGVAGKERTRLDGKRKTTALSAVAAREGRSSLPFGASKYAVSSSRGRKGTFSEMSPNEVLDFPITIKFG